MFIYFIPKAASKVALTPCGDEGEELFSCAGSSIITVAETLPRGATSLLSVSFSPPKLLILKSACKPFPHPPLISHRPSQLRGAGLPQPGSGRALLQRRRVLFFPKVLSEEFKSRPRFLPTEPRDVVGETCRAETPSRTAKPPPAPPRSAGTRPRAGKGFGRFPGSAGFLPSTRTGGVAGLVPAARPPQRRRRETLTPLGKPRELPERWAKPAGGTGRESGSSLCLCRTPSPARPRPRPGPPSLANLVWGNFLSLALSAAMSETGGAPGSPRHLLFGPAAPARRGGQGSGGRAGGGALPSSLRLKGSKIWKKNPSFVVTTAPSPDPLGEMEIWDYKHVCV